MNASFLSAGLVAKRKSARVRGTCFAAITALFFVGALYDADAQTVWDWRNDYGSGNTNWGATHRWYSGGNQTLTGIDQNIQLVIGGSQDSTQWNEVTGAGVRGVTFSSGSSARTVGGNLLKIGISGTGKIENASGNTQTLNLALSNSTANGLEINPVNALLNLSNIHLGTNFVDMFGNNTVHYRGNISGSAPMTWKTSSGTVTAIFSASNTLTSSFNIDGGYMILSNASAYVGTGVINIGSAGNGSLAELQLGAGAAQTNAIANSIDIKSASGNLGVNRSIASLSSSGTNTITGGVTNNNSGLSAKLFIASGGTLRFSNVVSGSGGFYMDSAGGGTLELSSSNTITGGFYIDAGTIKLSGTAANAGNGALHIGSSGGSANAALLYSGTDGGITASNTVTVNSGAGARRIVSENTSGVNTLSGNITLSNSLAFNVASGGTLLFGGGLTTLTGGSDVTRLALDGGGTLIVTNAGSGMPTTDRFQMRIGNGTLVIGAGTILARTNTSGLGHALDLGVDLTNAPVDAVAALRASNNVTVSNSIYVSTTNSQARIVGASGANATASFSGPIGLANAALWLDSTNGQTVSVSGAITNFSGTGSLIKTNAGLAILSGANTYVGTTLITNGNLRIANNSALGTSEAGTTVGSGAALEMSNNIAVTGEALTLNGTGISSGGALRNVHGNNSSSGAITLASASRINSDTGTLTLSGGITGTGAGIGLTIGGAGNTVISGTGLNTSTSGTLTKDGAGVLTMSAAGNYTGGTTLSEGTLRLGHTNAAGTGKITQTNTNSTLEINTTGTVANAMDLYNIRTMTNVTLSGSKTLFNAIYTVDSGTTTTESGVLSGTGGITKEGTGTLMVTASNSFTGNTAVNAGVLDLNSSTGSALGASTNVTVAATLLISRSDQVNDSATVSLSGGTIQRGSGVSETFGALNLTADSFLDFGSGTAGNFTFGQYEGGTTPSNKLTVNNFSIGNTLTFGSNVASFLPTGGSLSNQYFAFNNGFTYNSSTFTITAIPEPSTYLAAAGLLALFLWPVRRRLIQDAKSIFGLRPTGRERIEAYRNA